MTWVHSLLVRGAQVTPVKFHAWNHPYYCSSTTYVEWPFRVILSSLNDHAKKIGIGCLVTKGNTLKRLLGGKGSHCGLSSERGSFLSIEQSSSSCESLSFGLLFHFLSLSFLPVFVLVRVLVCVCLCVFLSVFLKQAHSKETGPFGVKPVIHRLNSI